jgi:hypothetical protein
MSRRVRPHGHFGLQATTLAMGNVAGDFTVQRPCFASILTGSKGNGDGGIVSLPQTCV